MRATAVVEIEVPFQSLSCKGNSFVAVQTNLFILYRLPEPFDEEVIASAALAIHADTDLVLFKRADESRTGGLTIQNNAPSGVHGRAG